MRTCDALLLGTTMVSTPSDYWRRLYVKGLLPPLLEDLYDTDNRHGETVFDHTMNVLDAIRPLNMINMFSALFHDAGKGWEYEDISHEKISAREACPVLRLWGVDHETITRISSIIECHMSHIKEDLSDKAVRNFIARVGEENLKGWFSLRKADSQAYSGASISIICRFEKRVAATIGSNCKIVTDPSGDGCLITGGE